MNWEHPFSRLEVFDICKSFKSKLAVNSVSLYVQSGEVVGLLGPNGAGKTTCFNMIMGLETCNQGSIWLNDVNITQYPIYTRARLGIGYLPQEPSIFRKLSVENNIKAILETRKQLTKIEQSEMLEQLLDEFHIGHLRKQPSTVLSGGERRRLEIARALAMEPHFILLDEPFAGVDPIAIEDVVGLIEMLCQKEVGILITDHNVRETLGICTRAYIVNEGSVIVSGNASEIMVDPDARRFYLGEKFLI